MTKTLTKRDSIVQPTQSSSNSAPNAQPDKGALEFSGERFIPGLPGEIWLEHWHRYSFASSVVVGKRVLDVACGEGYGSATLAEHALSVDGVDISPQAVEHAKKTYAQRTNLNFHCADCTALPFENAAFDVVVSFETIEHITQQEAFLQEVHRVLKPGGCLLISSPNKAEYSDAQGFNNEYHVKELYADELQALLATHFPAQRWYGQRNTTQSLITSESMFGEPLSIAQNQKIPSVVTDAKVQLLASDGAVDRSNDSSVKTLAAPLYFLVFAARHPDYLPHGAPALSQHIDSGEWLKRDYTKVLRALEFTVAGNETLQKQNEQLQEEKGIMQAGLVAVRETQAKLSQQMKEEAQRLSALKENAQRLSEQREAIQNSSAANHAARYRASFRWWLQLPLYRLRCWLTKKNPGDF